MPQMVPPWGRPKGRRAPQKASTVLYEGQRAEGGREAEGTVKEVVYYGDMTYYDILLDGAPAPVRGLDAQHAGPACAGLRGAHASGVGPALDGDVLLSGEPGRVDIRRPKGMLVTTWPQARTRVTDESDHRDRPGPSPRAALCVGKSDDQGFRHRVQQMWNHGRFMPSCRASGLFLRPLAPVAWTGPLPRRCSRTCRCSDMCSRALRGSTSTAI